MAGRIFEITLNSASNLQDVRLVGKMSVHARVSIGDGGESLTPTDNHGKTNPAWDHGMRFAITEPMILNFNTVLVVKLYCTRNLGDRYIGEVRTSMRDLYARSYGGPGVVSFPVQRGSVISQGLLRFSYMFG